jgi:hypothetical protein
MVDLHRLYANEAQRYADIYLKLAERRQDAEIRFIVGQ